MRRGRALAAALPCLLMLALTGHAAAVPARAADGTFSYTHLAVGAGHTAVYQGACGELGLIDADLGSAGVVLDELDRRGSRDLAWAVASHYHTDHIGDMVEVLTAPGVSVAAVHDRGGGPDAATGEVYARYHDFVTSPATERRSVHVGDTFSLCSGDEEVRFRVVSVGRDGRTLGGLRVQGENDMSVCLLVTFRAHRHATCGDINGTDEGNPTDVESAVAPHLGRVHTVLVNHHGAPESSNATYVRTLRPDVAVISAGANNHGHPAPEVVARWEEAGARVLQTQRGGPTADGGGEQIDGDVTVSTSGWDAYEITTAAGGEWTFPLPARVDDPPPDVHGVRRLAGPDRTGTALAVSRALWQRAGTVVVATGDDYPDALAAGAAAARHGAPLLLASPGAVEEVERLGAWEVLVVGGPAAVPDSIVDALRAGDPRRTVRRVAGPERFTTAAIAAAEAGAPGNRVTTASGERFPDALAAGAFLATAHRPPVLLTLRDRLPEPTLRALAGQRVSGTTLLGGTAAAGHGVAAALADAGVATSRVAGPGRYETSLEVLRHALEQLADEPRPLVVATGQQFPDALAAGAAAARLGGVLLLVPTTGPTEAQAEFVRAHRDRFSGAVVVGGHEALGEAAEEQMRDLLGPGP